MRLAAQPVTRARERMFRFRCSRLIARGNKELFVAFHCAFPVAYSSKAETAGGSDWQPPRIEILHEDEAWLAVTKPPGFMV